MQFDHRPGAVKVAAISQLTSSVQPLCVLIAEMAKCDLVCTNCHLVRTRERGLFKRTSLAVHGPTERGRKSGLVGWKQAGIQELSPQMLAQRVAKPKLTR